MTTGKVLAIVLLAATPALAATEGQAPLGTWLDQSGRAGITIAPCAEKLCGRVTWLKAPLDDAGKPKTDIHNDNAALRSRALCGLPILWGFSADGPDAWSGGQIYDPAGGSTYRSNMHVAPDGTLKVRGFVGISLFGRSETWTRPQTPLPHC